MEGFRAFNWESSDAWKSHLQNIELPVGDAAAALQKVKAKWYKRNIDPAFEVESVTAAPSKPAAPRSAFSQPAPQPTSTSAGWRGSSSSAQQPSGGGGAAPRAGAWGGASSSGGAGSWGASGLRGAAALQGSSRLVVLHAAMVLLAVFHIIPVLPIPSCSLRSYWWFMRVATFTQGYKVFLRFGAPSGVYPFHWPSLQAWLSPAMASTDFFYAMTSLAFMSTRSPTTLAMVPVLITAVRSLLAAGARQYAGAPWWQMTGARAQAWAVSKESLLDQVTTWAELALGFLLIVLLLTPSRSFLLLFFYWNMLKVRYMTPESAAAHRTAWAIVDERTLPYRQKFPMVEKVVQLIKGWFLSEGRISPGDNNWA